MGANVRMAWGVIGLLCAATAVAQQSEGPPWSGLEAKNPLGFKMSLRLTKPRTYRQGELIRAEVTFSGQGAPGQEPSREIWHFAGGLLDPAGDCGSLAAPCLNWIPPGVAMVEGSIDIDPMFRLGETPGPVAVLLNPYLPPLRPGRYRVAMLMHKLVLTGQEPASFTYLDMKPPQYGVSNTVEIDVVAATDEWVDQAIASSVAKLKGPPATTTLSGEAARDAAVQLRFLDVPPAWRASLAALPAEEYTLLKGLASTREPVAVCELMQSSIPAPTQAVSSAYVSTMAQICMRANLPPAPPYVPPPPGPKPPEPSAEQLRYVRRYNDYWEHVIGEAANRLAASVPGKEGDAKAIALETLMEQALQMRSDKPGQPWPAWVPAVTAEFKRSYAGFEPMRRRRLLGLYASTLRSPDMIPLLESTMDAWKPGDYYEPAREALQYLYSIDSGRAQARVVEEMAKARTWLDSSSLELLPAGDARLTDDALIEELDAAERAGGWNIAMRMTALAKYASAKALPRIEAIYESQRNACQPELMAYFVRVEPAYADRVFHSHPWDMHATPPLCTLQYFERTPRIAMGPVLERYMAAYLMHADVRVKKTAAQSLGRYGSAAAAGPLWGAFRYFHAYWKGKETELARNDEGVELEVELRNAIARGRHWLVAEADLRTIESLCISGRCVEETRQDLSQWRGPLKIEVSGGPGGIRGRVAQYGDMESIEAIEDKLGQFPKGTKFAMRVYGDAAEGMAGRVRRYAAARGLILVAQGT